MLRCAPCARSGLRDGEDLRLCATAQLLAPRARLHCCICWHVVLLHAALHVLYGGSVALKMCLQRKWNLTAELSRLFSILRCRLAPAALVAGCMPVYLGTPDIRPFLPHPDAALVYADAAQISAEMLRLMNDTADYERRVRHSTSASVQARRQPVAGIGACRIRFACAVVQQTTACSLCESSSHQRA